MSTARAILTGVRGIHRHKLPTGPCCLVRKEAGKLAPRHVMNALGETVVMHHPVDRQILNRDHIEAVYNTAAMLMGEIAPAPNRALIDTGHHLTPVRAFGRSLLSCALASACSSWRKKRGLAISCPVLSVANVVSPTSIPTGRPVFGKGDGSAHSHEKVTDHLPVLVRRMVAVLGVP